jgi:hypothetical protein
MTLKGTTEATLDQGRVWVGFEGWLVELGVA